MLVSEAGRLSSAAAYEVLQLSEVFYARPSVGVPNLLVALAGAAEDLARQAGAGLSGAEDAGRVRRRAVAWRGRRVSTPLGCREVLLAWRKGQVLLGTSALTAHLSSVASCVTPGLRQRSIRIESKEPQPCVTD